MAELEREHAGRFTWTMVDVSTREGVIEFDSIPEAEEFTQWLLQRTLSDLIRQIGVLRTTSWGLRPRLVPRSARNPGRATRYRPSRKAARSCVNRRQAPAPHTRRRRRLNHGPDHHINCNREESPRHSYRFLPLRVARIPSGLINRTDSITCRCCIDVSAEEVGSGCGKELELPSEDQR